MKFCDRARNASRISKQSKGINRHFSRNPNSEVDKFQFLLHNSTNFCELSAALGRLHNTRQSKQCKTLSQNLNL